MAREKICHQLYIKDPICGGVLFGELIYTEWVWFKNGDEKINSKYEGEIKNGVPNGKGTLIFPPMGKSKKWNLRMDNFDKYGILSGI